MLKSTKTPNNKASDATKKVAVIKNAHSAAELEEVGERWADHERVYMTLAEIMAAEKAKQSAVSDAS